MNNLKFNERLAQFKQFPYKLRGSQPPEHSESIHLVVVSDTNLAQLGERTANVSTAKLVFTNTCFRTAHARLRKEVWSLQHAPCEWNCGTTLEILIVANPIAQLKCCPGKPVWWQRRAGPA